MQFKILLFSSTAVIIIMTLVLLIRTRSFLFPIGAFALYFWSLYGAWAIVVDKLGGDSGFHYQYLEKKLFTIRLDDDYFLALLYYAIFIIIILCVAFLVVNKRTATPSPSPTPPIMIRHSIIIFTSITAGTISYLIVADVLAQSALLNESAYRISRSGELGGLMGIHQVLNRVALVPASIGLSILLSSKYPRFFGSQFRRIILLGYGVVLTGMTFFCMLLGNKNELLFSFLLGIFIYLINNKRPRYGVLATISVAVVGAIGSIDYLRGLPLLSGTVDEIDWKAISLAVLKIFLSNEAFGSHFSMYGAIHFDIPFTFGSDIISFLSSVIPRFFWPNRPPDIYFYYAKGVEATPGQGYSIHHAAGWYLNFGLPGIILGAILLGGIWGKLVRNYLTLRWHGSTWKWVFCVITPYSFTAYLPSIIRAGPTVYKGLIIEAIIIPVCVLSMAATKWQPNLSTMLHKCGLRTQRHCASLNPSQKGASEIYGAAPRAK